MFKEKNKNFILNGTYDKFKQVEKKEYKENIYLHTRKDYEEIGLNIDDREIYEQIKNTTKVRKNTYKHINEIARIFYPICLWTELGFKTSKRECNFKTLRTYIVRVLKDYPGLNYYWLKAELSDKGFYHVHGFLYFLKLDINEHQILETYKYKDKEGNWKTGHNKVISNYLKNNWYGETLPNGQPSKYGIYHLNLIDYHDTEDVKKIQNYSLKNMNTIQKYAEKSLEYENIENIDLESLFSINESNSITPRNSLVTKWIKLEKEQNKEIREYQKLFDTRSIEITKKYKKMDIVNYAIDNEYDKNPWTNILKNLVDIETFKKENNIKVEKI